MRRSGGGREHVGMWGRARRRAVILLAAVGLLAASGVGAVAAPISTEAFQDAAVADPAAWVASGSGGSATGWPGAPCLTAGTNTAQTPIKGCNLASPDGTGSGALRLTGADNSRSGIAFGTQALPTTGGLDISFHQAQYGATSAFGGICGTSYTGDGIAFFLVDGGSSSTTPGGFGGGLGYANTRATDPCSPGAVPGVSSGLLAVGLDAYGNGSNPYVGGTDCAAGSGPGSNGPGRTPNDVVIRGPGDANSGYCWLGHSGDLFTGHGIRLGNTVSGTGTRASTDVLVHIIIDPPSSAAPKVTVSLNGIQVVQVAQPAALLAASTFKYGFAASTGGANDIHEIWGLSIAPIAPLPPTNVAATPGNGSITVSWTPPANQGSSPVTSYLATTLTAQSCSAVAPSTSCTITGLAPGSYTVGVTASNASGTSASSATATTTVPAPVSPPAPGGGSGGHTPPPLYPNVVGFLTVGSAGMGATIHDHRDVDVGVTVPPGALPAGTVVGIYGCDPPAVRALVPRDETLVDCYAVEWTAPDGSRPVATAPVTLGVRDRAVRATDRLYESTGTRLIDANGSVRQGFWSTSFTVDPAFAVTTPSRRSTPALSLLPGTNDSAPPGSPRAEPPRTRRPPATSRVPARTDDRRATTLRLLAYDATDHPEDTVNLLIQLFALLALVLGGSALTPSAWQRSELVPGATEQGRTTPGPGDGVAPASGAGFATDDTTATDGAGGPAVDASAGLAAAGAFAATTSRRRRRRPAREPRGSASLAAAAATFAIGSEGEERGDRSRTWRLPATTHVDRLSKDLPARINRFSPVLAATYADGDYLRATFGSASILAPVFGVVAALVALADVDGHALPPSLGLMAVLILIGVFDSAAGLAATAVFSIGVVLGGGIESTDSVRTLMGLGVVWFAIPLLARSARPLRALWPRTQESRWDRAADFVIASLTGAWATGKMIKALPGLSGFELPIVEHASTLAYVVLGGLAARLLFETVTEHWYPKRLGFVAAGKPPPPNKVQRVASVLTQTALLGFIASAFVGGTWQLYAGLALFAIPLLLIVFQERLPNSRVMYRWLPTNVVKVLIMLIIGTLWALVVFGAIENATDLIAYSFLLLAVPGAIFLVLRAFGREGTGWTKTWPLRFAGVAVVVTTVLLATGTIKIT